MDRNCQRGLFESFVYVPLNCPGYADMKDVQEEFLLTINAFFGGKKLSKRINCCKADVCHYTFPNILSLSSKSIAL